MHDSNSHRDPPARRWPPLLRVLLLEDSRDDTELVARALRRSGLAHRLLCTATRAAFAEALERFAPDVILVDCVVPGFDGLSAIRLARRRRPVAPVIVVTGVLLDDVVARFLPAGAADYILKDRLARLGPAVQRAVAAQRAQSPNLQTHMGLRG